MSNLKIEKSSRHSKITGDFSEHLILYWLSKYGFECARVDHVGIDLIARNPTTKEFMGISVKSRSRNEGKDGQYVSLPKDNFEKIDMACEAFGCVPYFAIVVDELSKIHCFILSKEHLLDIFPIGKSVSAWKMSNTWLEKYKTDSEIKYFSFEHSTSKWW
jgi:hypothetical protein